MFKTAILLNFLDISNKSRHLLHQVASETLILSKYSIYKIQTFIWKYDVLDLSLQEPFSKNIL